MSTSIQTGTLTAVCKLRQVRPYKPTDQMIIRNLEALRLMGTSIMLEQKEQWDAARIPKAEAKEVLDKELNQFLGGIRHTIPIATSEFGFADLGGVY